MKIIGITRVRNEAAIIKNTLDHVAKLVDHIIVVDDASTDETPMICMAHPAVYKVLLNHHWASDPHGRRDAEGSLRTKAYREAEALNPDWVYYFDADEYADFTGIDFENTDIKAYRLRLFDFYITPADVDAHYLDRQFMGCEYRDILMLFRPHPALVFGEREPNIPQGVRIETAGFVKHYGKAISVEEWEKTCDYYIHNRGGDVYTKFRDKWLARKGKAVHEVSDFGGQLIRWEDRFTKGIKLVDN